MPGAEVEDAILEGRTGQRHSPRLSQKATDRPTSPSGLRPAGDDLDRFQLKKAQAVRLLPNTPHLVWADDLSQIEQGACGARGRNSVPRGSFVGFDRHSVQSNPRPARPTSKAGDVDRSPWWEKAPEPGGAEVAEDRALAVCEDRGEPMTALAQTRRKRVDTPMDPVEPPATQPPVDGAPAKPEIHQLPSRDNSMLSAGQLRQRSPFVDRPRFPLPPAPLYELFHDCRCQAHSVRDSPLGTCRFGCSRHVSPPPERC